MYSLVFRRAVSTSAAVNLPVAAAAGSTMPSAPVAKRAAAVPEYGSAEACRTPGSRVAEG